MLVDVDREKKYTDQQTFCFRIAELYLFSSDIYLLSFFQVVMSKAGQVYTGS